MDADNSFMDDFSLQESNVPKGNNHKSNARNLNSEFERINKEDRSEGIESF
jgi:hypothetical protein